MSPIPMAPAIAFVAFTFFTASKQPDSQLKGEYREINVTRENEAIATFLNGTDQEKKWMSWRIEGQPHRYAPVAFFHLSVYLHQRQRVDEALSWLYRARIRTYYDIQRCTDPSVGDAAEVMNRLVPPLLKLEQYADLEKSKRLMIEAMSWDSDTPHQYDARWIALHGIRASLPEPAPGYEVALLIPEDQWTSLAERNRKDYVTQWLTDVSSITAEQMEQIHAKYDELQATTANGVEVEDTALENETADAYDEAFDEDAVEDDSWDEAEVDDDGSDDEDDDEELDDEESEEDAEDDESSEE